MSITESESGLSHADFLAIPDKTGSLAVEVAVQRYGPVWGDHPNDTGNGRSGNCFDAILIGQYLVRAYGSTISQISADYMPSEVSGITDASWTTIDATNINSIDEDIPISLIAGSGLAARLFYVDTANVLRYSDCADITVNAFSAGSVVCSPADDILQIAATSTTRVHYITETGQTNRRLHYAEHDGSWSTTSSHVYWPFPVYGFDAVTVDDEDILLLASELPPLIGSRVIGAEVQKQINKVQGLVVFRVRNSRWSEWMPTDVIDRVPPDYLPARKYNRLSYHNDLLFTTYTRASGDGDYQYTKPAVTRSADGSNWEFPELIPDSDTPFVVLPRDDYLYAVSVSGTLRSPRCAWAGQTPIEYDITSRILQTESQAAEIRQSNASIANPPDSITDMFQGVLEDELPLEDDRLQLEYSLGYHIGSVAKRVQVSLEDVIQRGEQRGLPNLNLALNSQDYLGRVNRVRSDYAAEWPGIQCGRDPFTDTTGTGYGGLRHMAPIKPSFKADNGILDLISKNKESIAVSTFVSDALCGSAQCSFQVVNDDQNEFIGITFRVFDKDNLYYVAYHPDENYFLAVKRTGQESMADSGADADEEDEYTDETLATSVVITDWSSTQTDEHWMKILVLYNKLYLYRSDDGLTWETVQWASPAAWFVELPGHTTDQNIVWSGRFGVIGYGYSEADEPPTWDPPGWDPPIIQPDTPDPDGIILFDRAHLVYTGNFQDTDPTWYDRKGNLEGVIWAAKMDCYGNKGAWALTGTDNVDQNDTGTDVGLWWNADIASSSTWTLVLSQNSVCTNPVWSQQIATQGCDAEYQSSKGWGAMRSLVPCNDDGVFVVESKSPGQIGPTNANMYNASALLEVDNNGHAQLHVLPNWAWQDWGCCAPADDCHAGQGYAQTVYWCTHTGNKSCHQIVLDSEGFPLVGGAYMVTDIALFCKKIPNTDPPQCSAAEDYYEVFPLGSKPSGFAYNEYKAGTTHRTWDGNYAVIHDGDAGAQGTLVSCTGTILDTNIYNSSFVGITVSGSKLYWCKQDPAKAAGINRILKAGVAFDWDSEDLFGVTGLIGTIGYIGALPTGKERLIIVRKNKPAPDHNTSVVYWWKEGMVTPEDKTGNMNDVLGADKWSGTGPLKSSASASNIYYDNVGASCFECQLP